jgi:hypothetical protein
MIRANERIYRAAVKQSITGVVLPQDLCFRFFFHVASLSAVPIPENVAPAAFISQDNFALQ